MEQSAQILGNYRVWTGTFNTGDTLVHTVKDANIYKDRVKTDKRQQVFTKGTFQTKILASTLSSDNTVSPYVFETTVSPGSTPNFIDALNQNWTGSMEVQHKALEPSEYVCVMPNDNVSTVTLNTFEAGSVTIPADSLFISTSECVGSVTYLAATPYLVTEQTNIYCPTGKVMVFSIVE